MKFKPLPAPTSLMHIIDLILHLSSSSSSLLLLSSSSLLFLLQLIMLTEGRHDNDIKNLFKFIHHLEVVFVCVVSFWKCDILETKVCKQRKINNIRSIFPLGQLTKMLPYPRAKNALIHSLVQSVTYWQACYIIQGNNDWHATNNIFTRMVNFKQVKQEVSCTLIAPRTKLLSLVFVEVTLCMVQRSLFIFNQTIISVLSLLIVSWIIPIHLLYQFSALLYFPIQWSSH